MRIDIMTLFPDMCESYLSESIVGRARKSGFVEIKCHDIRSFTKDKHRRVDDYTYGGGAGMIMQPEPIAECFKSVCSETNSRPYCIYMSPQGSVFNQSTALRLSKMDNIAILCGHYEGVDERVIEEIVDEEISVGDFVLTGGELPALMVADAISRLLPGVLSGEECFTEESHFSGLLEYPQYTRPPVYNGKSVPQVLLSGHSANIAKWRRRNALQRTMKRRPDMLRKTEFSREDLKIMGEICAETDKN
ncbi:MAG TPA: tRNA (guanosine(37)-N1)-methyltransferase TrmD [Ruminiclostridium sp.]|nr:tRNA (guanosine(37)-N1)-methyltransferase TrmD [Ruminiclostridium sp.]